MARAAPDDSRLHPDDLREAPLSQLIRDLGSDAGRIVKDEVDLAKLELREAARRVVTEGSLLGVGAGVAALGGTCVVFGLVLGLGVLIDSYWLSALLVGGSLLVAGGLVCLKGLEALRSASLKPDRTVATLREDAAWARAEARSLGRGLRGG